jgi:hypothetical protein
MQLNDVPYFNRVRQHSFSGATEWRDGQDIAPEDIMEFGKRIYDLESSREPETRFAV